MGRGRGRGGGAASGRQFKDLGRKDPNAPEELVEVTALVRQGTPQGTKEAGDTFEVPARQARILARANMASTGGGEIVDSLAIREQAYRDNFDPESIPDPESSGQIGLATLDQMAGVEKGLGDKLPQGAMFRDSEDAARRRLAQGVYDESSEQIDEHKKKAKDVAKKKRASAKAGGVSRDQAPEDSSKNK